jgi:hypothetical protein
MGVLEKKQPSFVKFRLSFLEVVKKIAKNNSIDAYTEWQQVGDIEKRKAILNQIKQNIMVDYGFEPVIEEKLYDFEGPIESVANQVHHVFSTMYIIEKINAKQAARRH